MDVDIDIDIDMMGASSFIPLPRPLHTYKWGGYGQ